MQGHKGLFFFKWTFLCIMARKTPINTSVYHGSCGLNQTLTDVAEYPVVPISLPVSTVFSNELSRIF